MLIRDQGTVIVVDPGMVASRDRILGPLARLGVDPADVGDVVFSHHHPDHTLNAALFPRARVHDFWAIYSGDVWTDRPADGYAALAVGDADGHARAHRAGHHHAGGYR